MTGSIVDRLINKPKGPFWKDSTLLAILVLGAVVRLVFLLIGAKVYYGPGQEFLNGDSASYTMNFRNLIDHGIYTFDFLEPDAAFGRLPGYPFFYGIHYLIFGAKYAVQAVACTQTVLDCVSIVLIFLITRKIVPNGPRLAPYIAALLYAAYPFIIVWTTIIGTEQFATFLTLVWIYTLLSDKQGWGHYFLLGVEVALLFYVREFLGIFLVITGAYLLFSRRDTWRIAVRNCVLVGVGFMALYIWWPTRNYVYQHRIVLVKPQRAGFANYKADMVSFLDWVHSWSNESTYWLRQVLDNPNPVFPDEIFASPQEKAKAYALIKRANDCGSSFYFYKNVSWLPYSDVEAMRNNKDYMVECNDELFQGFEELRHSYRQHHPVAYFTKVPLDNLYKAFFKSGTQDSSGASKKQLLLGIVFGYRSLLLLLGVAGMVVFRRAPGVQPILMYWSFIIIFICWYFRQLEMRYLLQADVLLLIPAALLLGKWLTGYFKKRGTAEDVAIPIAQQGIGM